MGAAASSIQRTQMAPASSALPPAATDGSSSNAAPSNNNNMPPPPRIRKVETFEEKLYRKFTSEPLVPIGCLVTAYFLGSGIRSFYQRDPIRSQKMMRARVGAQFATLMIFIGYYGLSEFNLKFAPGMMPNASKRIQQQQKEKNDDSSSEEEGK